MKTILFIFAIIVAVVHVNGYKFLSKLLPDSLSSGDTWADTVHCYDKKVACDRAAWAQLTCDQSCVCKGYHWGVCMRSHKICTPGVPWYCQCYGRWFGRNKDFCKHQNNVPSKDNNQ